MKKKDNVLREFARQLHDDDVRYLAGRLDDRKSGDVGEVVEWIQQVPEVDRVLSVARDAWGLYDLIDDFHDSLDREWKRRTTYQTS